MKQKLNIAVTLAVALSLIFTSLALADNLLTDSDGLTPYNDTSTLSLGTVCSGTTTVRNVAHVITRQGQGNVFANGASVGVTIPSTSGSGLSATGGGTINLPSNWVNLPNNAQSNPVTSSITFVAGAAGAFSGTVNYSASGAKNGGGTLTVTDSLTVSANVINCDTTPPVIAYNVTGTLGNDGWYVSDVTVSWTVTDPESTPSYSCPSTTINYDTTGVTLSCSATSLGGASSASVTIKRDATAPGVTITPGRDPDYGDWYNAAVHFAVAGTDATSGIASCDADIEYSAPDSAAASVNASCTDNAGNAGNASHDFKYDGTLPEISYSVAPAPAASGWYNLATGAPKVIFTCADTTAGIESCTDPYTFGEGKNQEYTGTAKDNAGNTASAAVSGINVDLTAPTITWSNGPADGSEYYFGFVPAAPTCTASDELSGPNGCLVTGYASTVGSHTLTATAYDVAGNSKVEKRAYVVKAWTLNGFYQPVDMGGVWNTVKGGSTVPLKFEIFAGATELTDVASIKSFTSALVACTGGGEDAIEETVSATGGTVLRYDATAGQFIFNWQTPKTAGKCYRVTLTTQDGSALIAFFKLK